MTAAGLVLLHDAHTRQWRLFQQPVAVIAVHDLAQVRPALERIEQAGAAGYWAAGFLSYEAAPAFDPALQVKQNAAVPHGEVPPGEVLPDNPQPLPRLPLLWFGLYAEASVCDPQALPAGAHRLGTWQPNVERPAYIQAIERIKAHIARGETYQVNYTMRLQAGFSGDALGLFQSLCQAQPADYAAFVDTGRFALCSASPELFFTRIGTRLTSKPMKGTAGRGRTTAEDRAQAEWLYHSEKNRAENVMIVDMVRNDLGRIARTGSVCVPHLFEIERYPTVLQMTSTVEAESQAGLAQVMAALFPCASITGAPKVRTMQIITQLETTPRGVYTGCIGFIAPDAAAGWRAQFNVAIRTVQIDRGQSQGCQRIRERIERMTPLQKGRFGAANRHRLGLRRRAAYQTSSADAPPRRNYPVNPLKNPLTGAPVREPRRRGSTSFEATATYGVGGGIVWDSTSAEEYEECQIKARLLTQPRPVFSLLESLLWRPQEADHLRPQEADHLRPPGELFLLERHLRRLADAADYFGFPYREAEARAALDQAAAGLPAEAHKVRLLLGSDGAYLVQAAPLAQAPLPDPARLQLAPRPLSASSPFLYHKTSHREIYAQARAGLPADVEAVFWNEQGEVTESDSANLVARLDGALVTPPVACGLLPGTFRAWLLETGQVQERIIRVEELPRCSALFLVNSVRKWRAARLVEP